MNGDGHSLNILSWRERVIDRTEFWSRLVYIGPVLTLAAVLVWTLLLPEGLQAQFEEERRASLLVGPSTAPAPNLPGRLDGRSVGSPPGNTNMVAGSKWRSLGEQITSGGLSRVPTETVGLENNTP